MRFVYVLEDDPKFQKDILEAIEKIDPELQIRLFYKLDEFAAWLKVMMTTGAAAIAQGGVVPESKKTEEPIPDEAHQLVLIISKVEFLGAEQLGLLRKTRDLFVQRGLCTKEDPTGFVLTAFDNPNFKLIELEDRILNNVIFKPFDRLILTQHLTFAINGRHPPSENTIGNQKTTAVVEMLKDVELEAVSDIGFITRSYREIPVGAVAKYYGKMFVSDRHRSLFAICKSCAPHPKDPKIFQCVFTFFAADQVQISNLRKATRNKGVNEFPFNWSTSLGSNLDMALNVIVVDPEENIPSGLSGQLAKRFTGINVINYENVTSLLLDLDPAKAFEEKDQNLKIFDGALSVTLVFDLAGVTYIGCQAEQAEIKNLFGQPEANLKTKSNWFANAMMYEHRDKYRKYVQTQSVTDDGVLSLSVNDVPFLIKVTGVKKENGKIYISTVELTKDEQLEWLRRNSRLQKTVHMIFCSHRFFNESTADRWKFVKENLKKRFGKEPVLFMNAKKDFTDAEERSYGTYVDDIFFKPLDRVYIYEKIKSYFPNSVITEEKIEFKTVVLDEIVKTANPVTVTEISEAGFAMQYYRPITIGSFREIVLWQPYEIGAPEMLAACNFYEESSEKGVFNCHFVFFGSTDFFLRHIRVWIRDNYILSKSKGS